MTQRLPILYSFRRCPYAMRARMALMKASVTCELREVVLRNKPEQMTRLSPKGTVPVLQLPDGQVIDESLDLMRWALAQADPDAWLGVAPQWTERVIELNDGPFKQQLDRYKYSVRFPEHSREHYRAAAQPYLVMLEEALHQHAGKGLVSDQLTLSDYAVFPFVRQFSKVDLNWFTSLRHHCLVEWLQRIEAGPLFQSVMQKYPAWSAGDPLTVFGSGATTP
jgi:glutathione S-transferase